MSDHTDWTCHTCGADLGKGRDHVCILPSPAALAFQDSIILARIADALERMASVLENPIPEREDL